MNPEEAKVVKLIFYLYVHVDMGVDAICDYLNSHGYSKKKVKKNEVTYFTRGFVIGVLDNPVYIGKIAYGKYKTERIKGTRDQYCRVKQDTYILVDGLHESIIDDDTWDVAREKRARTGVKWNKTHSLSHEHILSGIIKCPLCGAGMSGTVQRRKNKKSGEYKDTFYYRCHHRKKADGLMCDYKPMLPQIKIDEQIEKLIVQMASNERMRGLVKEKLEEKVDVSYLEMEKKQLTGQLQQVNGSRKKLIQMIDQLDVGDKYYDRKHQDMTDRLNGLFDKSVELEEMIEEVSEKIKAANRNQISGKQVYQFLSRFDILYGKMTDLEKKEFMRSFVDTIELYPDEKDMTRIIKHVNLQFPIYYGECEGDQIRMPNESTVETVVLMSRVDEKGLK